MAGHVWVKQGVCGPAARQIRRAIGVLAELYGTYNDDLFITSICDSTHAAGSLHYDGNALDFKRRNVHIKAIREVLGADFDVIEYTDVRDIFHVEYDPK